MPVRTGIPIRRWYWQIWCNPVPVQIECLIKVMPSITARRSTSRSMLSPLKKTAPDFIVTFTEDKNGFYINSRKFASDATPMTTARVGTYQHWRIVNQTAELHPFYIHQVHFLAYAENGIALAH